MARQTKPMPGLMVTVSRSVRGSETWGSRDRNTAATQVTDAMLASMAICGSPREGRAQLERYRAAGITLPIVSFAHGATRDMIRQTLEALAG